MVSASPRHHTILEKNLGSSTLFRYPNKYFSDNMAVLAADVAGAVSPQIASGLFTTGLLFLFFYTIVRFPGWIKKLKLWQEYCGSHSKFSLQAGEGKYKWLEDPWSSESSSPHIHAYYFTPAQYRGYIDMCKENEELTQKNTYLSVPESRNYWLCRHEAIKHVFSRAAMQVERHSHAFLVCPSSHFKFSTRIRG